MNKPDPQRLTEAQTNEILAHGKENALAALSGAREGMRSAAMEHNQLISNRSLERAAATICLRPDDLHYAASVLLAETGATQEAALAIASAGLLAARAAVAAGVIRCDA